MTSKRSELFTGTGLALFASLALVTSSCMQTRSAHTLSVKAGGDDGAFATPHALQAPVGENEYFEGELPPETPAALPEERPQAPSPEHVWLAGHHTRMGGEWVWVNGRYALPPSDDVVWVPGHWVAHLHGYAWIPGAWR